jgi:hypothetical protein
MNSELAQETDVVPIEVTDVRHAIAAGGDPLHAEPKGESGD